MINLSNVTLLTIDGVGTDINAVKALKYSMKDINFGAVKYITAGDIKPDFCEIYKIPKLTYNEYNIFCLTQLYDYVNTEYVLLIQSDGFVINSNLWSNEFLNYDYIGAAWDTNVLINNTLNIPILKQKLIESSYKYNIGNGGFSLRSKNLLKATRELYNKNYDEIAEDAIIGVAMRKQLENLNLKFPPNNQIPFKFSCEMRIVDGYLLSSDYTFGFHCDETHTDKFNLLQTITL